MKNLDLNYTRVYLAFFLAIILLFLVTPVISQGFVDSFENGTVDTSWGMDSSGVYNATEQDGKMKIDYTRTADNGTYEAFAFFPPEGIDVSGNPKITIRIKSEVEFTLSMKPYYENDADSDNFANMGTVPGDSSWSSYTLDLKEANYSQGLLNQVLFFFDAGEAPDKSGVLYVDDFVIGAATIDTIPQDTILTSSKYTDDFEDDIVDNRWNSGGSGVYKFIEQNGVLQITYSRTQDNSSYEAFVFWPSEKIDVSGNPEISIKIKSDTEIPIALKPTYSNDDNSDNFSMMGTISGDGEWNTYTLDLKEDNYANDSLYELVFFFDPDFSGDKEGTVYFDDFALAIDTVTPSDSITPVTSYADAFENGRVDSTWSMGSDSIYNSSEQNGVMEIDYNRTTADGKYQAFAFFPPEKIEVSPNPEIILQIKSKVEFTLSMKPYYENDDDSDNFVSLGTIPGDGKWHKYLLELNEENYSKGELYQLLFFFDAGETINNSGLVYFDDFGIGKDITFPTPSEMIAKMGKGVNMGNTFEIKEEWRQNWGEQWIEEYKNVGFETVRIPVGWGSAWCPYTETTPPYSIDESWLNTIQKAVDWVLERGMCAIINSHHDDWVIGKETEGWDDPYVKARFDSIWTQISRHFAGYPAELIFEIYNEPTNTEFECSDGNCMDQEDLDDMHQTILNTIRKTNPKRYVIYGGLNWSKWYTIDDAAIPNDPVNNPGHVIATFHYYEPYNFTHEGNGTTYLSRCTWGSSSDKADVNSDFDEVRQWADNNNIGLFVGEFAARNNGEDKPECGTNERQSVLAWTHHVAKAAYSGNMAYTYWGDGGHYDLKMRTEGQWDTTKVNSILLRNNRAPGSVTGISVSPESLTMQEGDTSTLSATIIPSDALDKSVIWESSDPFIAKVDSSGNVIAIRDGKVLITAKSGDGGYSGECNVTVKAADTLVNVRNYSSLFKVYPNPSNGIIHVEGEGSYDVSLYDIRGILVKYFNRLEEKETLYLNNLNKGIYIIKIGNINENKEKLLIIN